jgi:hypothetical protein
MLVVEPDKLFETCIIPKSTSHVSTPVPEPVPVPVPIPVPIVQPNEPVVLIEDVKELKEEEEVPIIPTVDPNEPVEVDLFPPEDETVPPIQLKKRNDVYYKLYKEARSKAREAKQIALANYLEAKRIKNAYLLEDMSESDEDEPLLNSDDDYDE